MSALWRAHNQEIKPAGQSINQHLFERKIHFNSINGRARPGQASPGSKAKQIGPGQAGCHRMSLSRANTLTWKQKASALSLALGWPLLLQVIK